MSKIYSVSIVANNAIPYEYLHAELSSFDDWLAFSPNQYFVRSSKSVQDVSNVFRAHLHPNDYVFSAPIDVTNMWGWMPMATIEWLNRNGARTLTPSLPNNFS